MNKLDLIILILLAIAFVFGYRRGFVLQLISLFGLFAACLVAYLFYDDIAPWVGRLLPIEAFVSYTGYGGLLKGLPLERYVVGAVSFALLLAGVKIGLSAAGHVLNVLAKAPGLNLLNRWSGGVLALLEAAVITAVALHVMAILPYDTAQSWLNGSRAFEWSMEWTPALLGKMKELPSYVI